MPRKARIDIPGLLQHVIVRPGKGARQRGRSCFSDLANLFAVEPQEILRRARMDKVAEAKAVFCYAAIRVLGLTGSKVAKHLGMGSFAVSRAVARGEEFLRNRSTVKKKLEKALNH